MLQIYPKVHIFYILERNLCQLCTFAYWRFQFTIPQI